ncbi:MAG: cysteine synthase A [Oscillospiraceae bacterium]|nr:cysteine synthase A [Oscillospiraceae bacterium]
MNKIYGSVEELIGLTPILELKAIKKKLGLKADILAKLECFNPGGSAKDRAALSMINDAEEKGILNSSSVIIEPTSGNTGIGLSLVAAARGYKTIIVMPDTMSEERRRLMKAYGAELVLTDGKLGMAGAINKAEEIAANTENSFLVGQFSNKANPKAHFDTTGPEIYDDTNGNIDIFVAGIGTGGTITGVGSFLKSKNPDIKIVGVEPEESPFLTKEISGAHKIQGIGAGFKPEILDLNVCDEILTVSGEEAYEFARLMGGSEGVLVGISSGAALSAAVKLSKRPENEGKRIVVLLPDTGERYLSTGVFD